MYGGIKSKFGPMILLDPSFAITFKELKDKLQGKIKISKDSTFILEGHNTIVKDLTLDGHLESGEEGLVTGVHKGEKYIKFEPADDHDREECRIRGYRIKH